MSFFRGFIATVNRVIPEVEKPKQRPSLKERIGWTAVVLFIYYILTQIPLYGVETPTVDILSEFRVIFAGASGSIVELGIGPVVTAGIVLELLVGSKIIPLDLTDPENRRYFQQAQRVAALAFIFLENAAYVLGGRYGRVPAEIPWDIATMVIAQLILGSVLLMMLDDLVSKWGIGSGISLFILAGVAQRVLWGAFSPVKTREGRVVGAIPALIEEGIDAIYRAGGLPDLAGLIATIIVFLIVVWAYEVRVEVPIAFTRVGGQRIRYPLRLLYVSNIPIIFTQALYGDIRIVSTLLWNRLHTSTSKVAQTLISILGRYQVDPVTGNTVPVGGLMYYITSPGGPSGVAANPGKALIYLGLYVLFSVAFAKVWVITSGMDAESVARQFVAQGMVVPGRRASPRVLAETIKGYVEAVTLLGGALVGLLAALADFSGAIGTGSGILLAVTITASFYEVIARERAIELYPRLAKILGV
uniref:Protein translocase subunit SecY n=1 Tax=uncultured korarchaeote TaxID=161241 RepID=A0A1L2JQ09_9CREN|nr:preprotein translocase subunit SecY [uncultured korarchaeote]